MSDQPPKPPQGKPSPPAVTAGEVPPTALYYGPGADDCIDYEVFGTPSSFRSIAQVLLKNQQQKPKE
jgi:hypothetical protein